MPRQYVFKSAVEKLTHSLGMPGFRSADPGEFTKRAFLNGRMDLTEVIQLPELDLFNSARWRAWRISCVLRRRVSGGKHFSSTQVLDCYASDAANARRFFA